MAKVKNIFKIFKHSSPFSDWNRTDEKLLKAVETYDITKVHSILNKKVVSTTKCGPKGYSALHYACVKGYEDLVEMFISHKADLNICNERGSSPLHLASHNGFPNIVSRLLRAGANVDLQNPYLMTALHIACNSKNESIVKILVEYKANINATDKTQKTPLFFSCYHGNLNICKYLIENGADINAQEISKVTPLLTALRQNHVEISKFLLKKGADPYIKDRYGESAITNAQESTSREMRKVFSGLPLEAPDARSSTSSEIPLQRDSFSLSTQVLNNFSFGEDLASEMEPVQLRNSSDKQNTQNNEVRPQSAPPPPPPQQKRNLSKSISEDFQDWELVDNIQQSLETSENMEATNSIHPVTKNIEDKALDGSLSVNTEEDLLPPLREKNARSVSEHMTDWEFSETPQSLSPSENMADWDLTENANIISASEILPDWELAMNPPRISESEILPDWEVTENRQLFPKNTEDKEIIDSFHTVSENIEAKELNPNLSVFPSDNLDGRDARFREFSLKEHRSCLSKPDIKNMWDQEREEDVISNTSQHSDQTQLDNYGLEFSFIPGNATPKVGTNNSLRRQILTLRQENNQLRESIHDNRDKIKDQEEEIKRLENLLSEEKKNVDSNIEKSEVLSKDDNDSQTEFNMDADNLEENEDEFYEKVARLIQDNEEFLKNLAISDQHLKQEKVSSLLHENLNLMQGLKQLSKRINKDFLNFEIDLKEEPEQVTDQQDDVKEIQELEELKEQHVHLQNNNQNIVSSKDNLLEAFDQLKEERDRLITSHQRLKQDNEQATKQNCNLLNMKDNLQQKLEEMVEQQKNLQEKYDLLCEKTEMMEKTLNTSEDDQKLNLSHFDETEDLLEVVEAKESWENDKNEELKVLQLDNSLLEEQCRKLLIEKDILEEENTELKQTQDARIQVLVSEKEELWAEKVKLGEKLEEMIKETCSLQQKNSLLQEEILLLKCQGENTQSDIATENMSKSKIQILENEITKLQQELIQTEKKYKEIVQNYRLHLIGAIQGYVDPEVEKALHSIIELRRMEFYC